MFDERRDAWWRQVDEFIRIEHAVVDSIDRRRCCGLIGVAAECGGGGEQQAGLLSLQVAGEHLL